MALSCQDENLLYIFIKKSSKMAYKSMVKGVMVMDNTNFYLDSFRKIVMLSKMLVFLQMVNQLLKKRAECPFNHF